MRFVRQYTLSHVSRWNTLR